MRTTGKSKTKAAKPTKRKRAASSAGTTPKDLIALSADWYWEQDAEFRFTHVESQGAAPGEGVDGEDILGKHLWEIGLEIQTPGGWDMHRTLLAEHQVFRDIVLRRSQSDGTSRYVSVSGAPIFDSHNDFRGYHGIGKDVTEQKQREEELLRFRAAMDATPDMIHVTDRSAMRFLWANETAVQLSGFSRDELLKMGPEDVLRVDRRVLEHMYDEVIAAGPQGTVAEIKSLTKDGTRTMVEVRRRALRVDDRWIIITISQDISARKRAEQATARISRMFAALSATNEAIMRAKSAAEMYQHVCEAAVEGGKFLTTAVLLPDGNTGSLKIAAAIGLEEQLLPVRISIDATVPEGKGLAGTAFRTRQPCISNDFLSDERTQPWRALAQKAGIAAGAAVPLCRGSAALGILLFYSADKRAFDNEIVKLLEHLAENVVFALDNFEREAERERADQRLRESEERFRALTHLSSDWYWEQDTEFRFTRFESRKADKSDARQHFIGKRPWEGQFQIEDEGGWDAHRATLTAHQPFRDVVFRILLSSGKPYYISVDGEPVFDRGGRFLGYRGISRDMTKQKRSEEALRQSEARFRSLTELTSDWYWEQDAEFRFTRFEGHHKEVLQRFIGKTARELGFEVEGGWKPYYATFNSRKPFRDLVSFYVQRGERRYVSISGEPIFDSHGRFIGHRGISRDITEKKRAEERIQYLATHDGLTELPNRVMFSQLLNLAIESARRYERRFAVLFIDLDRFKIINDTLGHETGDQLLKEMAVRLKQCLRASDVVARLGGDEFVVLLQEVTEANQVATVSRKILSAVLKPMPIRGQECRVTASVGISMYPNDAQDEQTLMKNADMAMYVAKEEGKNNFQFYSKDTKTQSLERMTLEVNLRHALERNELSLHYQAKLDLRTGTINGVEALLRWENPELGAISPTQLIPVAEETGLIIPIGRWVMKTACLQNIAWQKAGLPPVCMAVNLSPRQFSDPDLVADIASILEETGMAPQLLELEITESMVMHNTERAVKLLTAIKEMGVRLAIDDFGTGYSSLAQIKRFPIDTLKVDRSFIREIPRDTEDRAITEAIIAMGKTLSLTVVAEGVETQEQAKFLRQHSCDEMQGYYFSKPVKPEDFAELLRKHVSVVSK